jgi:DNA-binding transcriptional LysR family regulator
MNIDHLHTFLEVVASGSFHRAADNLNVTQSTVSARIRALEERLDRRLFVRHKNGVEITGAGRRLRRHADTVVRAWELGRQRVALPEGLRSVFGFGVHANLADWVANPWLDAMRRAAPDVALNVDIDYTEPLTRKLEDGLLDMLLVFGPRTGAGLVIDPLIEDELVLVSTYPREISSGWLDDYIFVERGFEFSAAHAEAFPDADTPALAIDSPAIALAHILAHDGSCYLSRSTIAEQIAGGLLFEVEGAPRFRLDTFIVRPREPLNEELIESAMAALRSTVGVTV